MPATRRDRNEDDIESIRTFLVNFLKKGVENMSLNENADPSPENDLRGRVKELFDKKEDELKKMQQNELQEDEEAKQAEGKEYYFMAESLQDSYLESKKVSVQEIYQWFCNQVVQLGNVCHLHKEFLKILSAELTTHFQQLRSTSDVSLSQFLRSLPEANKLLIHKDLGTVLTPGQTRSDVQARHSSTGVTRLCPLSPSLASASAKWGADSANQLLIITGASGEGKTVAALQIAKSLGSNSIIFYFVMDELGILTYTPGDTETRDKELKKGIRRTVKEILDCRFKNFAADKTHPQITVVIDEVGGKNDLVRGLCSIVFSGFGTDLYNQLVRDEDDKDDDGNVRYVSFIATGTGASYAGTAAGSTPGSFTILRLKQHLDQPVNTNNDNNNNNTTNNNIIDQGNNNNNVGSSPSSSIFQFLVKSNDVSDLPVSTKKLLLRLCSDFNPSPTTDDEPLSLQETVARDLVTNPRVAAFIVRYFVHVKKTSMLSPTTTSGFRDALIGATKSSISKYISCNGLKSYKNPAQVLLIAFAVSFYRLPFLPQTGRLKKWFIGEEGVESNLTLDLDQVLCSKGGILVDTAQALDTPNELHDYVSIQAMIPNRRKSNQQQQHHQQQLQQQQQRSQQQPANQKEQERPLYLKKTATARFDLSVAHVAMLRAYFGFGARSTAWYGFEDNTMDFCSLAAAASSVSSRLLEECDFDLASNRPATMSHSYGRSHSSSLPFANHLSSTVIGHRDRLFALKTLFLESTTQDKSRSICGVDSFILEKSQSPVQLINWLKRNCEQQPGRLMNEVSQQQQQEHQRRVCASAAEFNSLVSQIVARTVAFNEKLRSTLAANRAVVFQCPEMEQFADIVVVSYSKVLLIQCKQRLSSDETYLDPRTGSHGEFFCLRATGRINFGAELQKMNFAADLDSNDLQDVFGFLIRDFWIAALVDAASGVSKENSSFYSRLNTWRDVNGAMQGAALRHFTLPPSSSVNNNNNKTSLLKRVLDEKKLFCRKPGVTLAVEISPIFLVECGSVRYLSPLQKDFLSCCGQSKTYSFYHFERNKYVNYHLQNNFTFSHQSPTLSAVLHDQTEENFRTSSSVFYPIPLANVVHGQMIPILQSQFIPPPNYMERLKEEEEAKKKKRSELPLGSYNNKK